MDFCWISNRIQNNEYLYDLLSQIIEEFLNISFFLNFFKQILQLEITIFSNSEIHVHDFFKFVLTDFNGF